LCVELPSGETCGVKKMAKLRNFVIGSIATLAGVVSGCQAGPEHESIYVQENGNSTYFRAEGHLETAIVETGGQKMILIDDVRNNGSGPSVDFVSDKYGSVVDQTEIEVYEAANALFKKVRDYHLKHPASAEKRKE